MDRVELEILVREALNMMFARDASLLDSSSSEWALAHRLAVYLEQLLPGWNIDCEYNRQGEADDPKRLATGSRVRPDIIVHHRGRVEPEHNLLAIELKKSGSNPDFDKVREYTATPSADRLFQYRYGLAVEFTGSCKMTWFEDGRRVS